MKLKKILSFLILGLGTTTFATEAVIQNEKDTSLKEWMGIPYTMNRWGISVLGVNQTEKGKISNVELNNKILNKLNANIRNADSIKVTADVKLLKADYFVLPFLSVYGVYGQLDADVKLKLGDIYLGNYELTPFPVQSLNTKGDIYGAGFLLAGEYKNIFLMLQYTHSEIHMKNGLAEKTAQMANGRLGYSFKPQNKFIKTFTPYVGAAYQLMDTQVSSQVVDPKLGAISAVIDLELDEITPAAGVFMQLPYNMTLLVEATWGTRDSIAIDLGYRF
ncbi:MAG: autotransporter outer membrane beta-barrel domain-containing protein [Fusobacteriaceae bacterium]